MPNGVSDTQTMRVYNLLADGKPKSVSDFQKAGVNVYSLKSRLHDAKKIAQRNGGDILHHSGPVPTWELVLPGGSNAQPLGIHRDESGQAWAFA